MFTVTLQEHEMNGSAFQIFVFYLFLFLFVLRVDCGVDCGMKGAQSRPPLISMFPPIDCSAIISIDYFDRLPTIHDVADIHPDPFVVPWG